MLRKNTFLLFSLVWFGDFISTIGSGLTAFSLGVYAYTVTGKASSTAAIVLCNFAPAFVLRPLGGILADRWNRSFLMIVGSLGSAAGVLLVYFMLGEQSHNLGVVYPGVLISSLFFALQNPAYKASVSDYLSEDLYAKASGLLQLSGAAQFLIAPLLGGFLISMMGIKSILLIDAMTFIFSAGAVAVVRFIHPSKAGKATDHSVSFAQDFVEGIRAIVENKGILVLVSLVSLLLFYIGLIQVLLTPMVLSFSDAQTLGVAQSVCAIGMLVSSILISATQRRRKNTEVLAISLGCMGLFFAFIGIRPNIWAIVIPGLLFFSVIPYANSSIDVLIRQNIDNEKQGRVWSLISVFTYLGSLIAYGVGGFLADRVFNPLLVSHGKFSTTLGLIFGVGNGRGIALMFGVSGLLVMILALSIYKSKSIWSLEADNEPKKYVLREQL